MEWLWIWNHSIVQLYGWWCVTTAAYESFCVTDVRSDIWAGWTDLGRRRYLIFSLDNFYVLDILCMKLSGMRIERIWPGVCGLWLLLGRVLFFALDAVRSMEVTRLFMTIWLTIVALRRISIYFMWFFYRNYRVWNCEEMLKISALLIFLSSFTKF